MDDYKIGDIVYGSWGYNSTNVEFYKVVSRTDKTLIIQPIESKVVDGDPMRTYYVVADESKPRERSYRQKGSYVTDSKPFRVHLNKRGCAVIRVDGSFADQYLSIWDGTPKWANTGFNG